MRNLRLIALLCAMLVLGGGLSVVGGPVAAKPAQDEKGKDGKDGQSTAVADSWSQTKEMVRRFAEADGTLYEFTNPDTGAPYQVTVSVDHTQNLRGRERVEISWTGAQPSGGRAADPYGEKGLQQEYPVVIMQCRGTPETVTPETCWTSSVAQRSMISQPASAAVWLHDLDAPAADKEKVVGVPAADKDACKQVDWNGPAYTRVTPFVAASGKVYAACDSEHMPPEAAVDSAFPPAEVTAFTDASGKGSVQFEVRSDVENESLGCNQDTACSIVVVPIVGVSCDHNVPAPTSRQSPTGSASVTGGPTATADPSGSGSPSATETVTSSPSSDPSGSPSPTEDTQPDDGNPMPLSLRGCRRGGRFLPGTSNGAGEGIDLSVGPRLWWSASNWKNRFTVPITFGPPPDACDILDSRAPTGFYGSELLAQAALQWAPAYCLNKKRFKFQHNQMPDQAGFSLMDNGGGAAALVSSAYESGSDPVGYAPTAVTGFSIGYVIDRPDNAGEYTDLRLNARLLAKLLTQSYPGSDLGRAHPGMEDNPLALMNDPEFKELNPGLSEITQEAGAALLSLSNSADVVYQLTDYIAHDRDAMAFVNGQPDPWGMVVNPSYKKVDLPRAEWPLLDTFVPQTHDTCMQANPAPYFTQLAAPVTTLRKIAEALLDAWPNVQTRCDTDVSTNPPTFKLGRKARQGYGTRFMLGVVSLGDAERFGLRSAALETKPGVYVAPTPDSLGAALKLAKQSAAVPGGDAGKKKGAGKTAPQARPTTGPVKYAPYVIDQAKVRRSAKAYPGTMVVYTAAKLANLPEEDAAKVAQFIRIATTEGQRRGSGNGQLPGGYLPITNQGVTGELFRTAQAVAGAVEKQKSAQPQEEMPSAPEVDPDHADIADVPVGAVPAAGAGETSVDAATGEAVAMPQTQAVGSDLGGRLLPLLILLGLLAGALTLVVRTVVIPRSRR